MSAIRWVVIDALHSRTGVALGPLDFSKLGENVEGFRLLIEIHYQHFLFYSNMLIATAIAYGCYRVKLGGLEPVGWPDAAFVVVGAVFYVTSRDTLQKYYTRAQQLLAPARRRTR